MGAGYVGVFSSWKFTELYNMICVHFLDVFYNSTKKFWSSYKNNNKIYFPTSSGSPFSSRILSNTKEPRLLHPFLSFSLDVTLPCILREKQEHSSYYPIPMWKIPPGIKLQSTLSGTITCAKPSNLSWVPLTFQKPWKEEKTQTTHQRQDAACMKWI